MRMTHQQVQTQKGRKKQEAARNTNKKVSQIEATVQQHVLQRWLSRKEESGFWFRKLLQGTISCYNQEGRHLDRLSHPRAKGQVANLGIQRQVKLHGFAIEAQHPDLGIFQ